MRIPLQEVAVKYEVKIIPRYYLKRVYLVKKICFFVAESEKNHCTTTVCFGHGDRTSICIALVFPSKTPTVTYKVIVLLPVH